jgi:hypothetical protein
LKNKAKCAILKLEHKKLFNSEEFAVIKKTISLLLIFALVTGLFTFVPHTASAENAPVLLMSLTRTEATLAEEGNKFTADEGMGELTAWDNNEQIIIGGTGRTPIVINNAALYPTSTDWQAASVVGLENASAFQIKFNTTGFDDIRFSCRQKSTGSGPDAFRLAYRVGSGGEWVAIPDSLTGTGEIPAVPRVGDNTYGALEQTYDNFILPDAVNNQAEVYLRIYFDGIIDLTRNGNTSINDIRITSGAEEPDEPELGDRPAHLIINQVYGRALADGSASNGFIELYNPTDAPVNLAGMSLQYMRGKESNGIQDSFGDWQTLPLTGTIAANSSFLIISDLDYASTSSLTLIIGNYDMKWNIGFSNRAFSVRLMDDDDSIVDLVGVTNTNINDIAPYYESASFSPISNQRGARRIDFADYNENHKDFESIDYRSANLAEVRPRWSGDGAWGADIRPLLRVPEVPKEQQLVFSRTSGFFNDAFNLTLSTGFTDGVIRYTLDGSEPTNTSAVYSAPISISNRTAVPVEGDLSLMAPTNWRLLQNPQSKGTVVRAAVFDADGKPLTSSIHTQTFFVGLCENYPNLPVITLSTDSDNLFNWYTGIYQTGPGYIENFMCDTCTWVTFCACPNSFQNANFNQRGREWERPVHFEIIEADGTTFAQDMGLRIHGNWSRLNPQKSLRLYARDEYSPGRPTFNYDLFDGDAYDVNGNPITTFQRFLLRQAGQDNGVAMMRDSLLQSAGSDLNVIRQSYRQAVLFINGEFWGYYDIRERVDEYYLNDNAVLGNRRNAGYFQLGGWGHWPGEASDVQTWSGCNADCYRLAPSSEAFCLGPVHWSDQGVREDYKSYLIKQNWFNGISGNMTDAEYLEAQRYIDIDNLIDYWAYCMIVANDDWPGNNVNFWRYRTDYPDSHEITGYNDGRWRYSLRDMDMAYGIFGDDKQFRILRFVMEDNDYVTTLPLRKLMTHADFRERFIARACDIMNTYAHASVMIPRINEFANRIDPIMDEQIRRWNNPWWGSREGWRNNGVQPMLDFAAGRQVQFLGQMSGYFSLGGAATLTANIKDAQTARGHIRVNTIDIAPGTANITPAMQASWSGQYLRGSYQTITAVPADGYRFMRFVINGISHESQTIRFNLTGNTVITVEFLEAGEPDTPPPPPPPVTPVRRPGGGGGGGGGSTAVEPVVTPAAPEKPAESKPHEFTTADALNILRFVAGLTELTAEQAKLYDINGDGAVDTADALAILRYIAGITDGI